MLLVLFKYFFIIIAVNRTVVLSTLTKVVALYSLDIGAKLVGISTSYTSVIGQILERCYETHPCNFNKFQSPGLQVAAPKVLV